MVAISIDFSPIEAIRTASALEEAIKSMRKFCKENDCRFGSLNNLHREAIADDLRVYKALIAGLRAAGWPMSMETLTDDPIDAKVADDVITGE